VIDVEAVDDQTRTQYKTPYQDVASGVLLEPVLVTTVESVLSITLFGSPAVTQAGQPVVGFVSSKAAALLYYLAATQRIHSRDTLAALFWPDAPPETAKKNLRDILSNLRRLLGPYLAITRNEVGLDWKAGLAVDYADFLGQLAVANNEQTAAERTTRLAAATNLYVGDLLAGFYLQEAEPFEAWLTGERDYARQRVFQSLHQLIDHAKQMGAYVEGIDYASRLLTYEPWDEQTHRDLMLLLAQSGQRGAALAQYEQCRRILAQELGIQPADETTELYDRLLAANDSPPHNLPAEAHLENLLGRRTEVAEIMRLLAQAECRLLTLTGLGGVGKTRLALQVARLNLNRFLDGVYWVALDAVDAAELLVSAIGDALGFTFPGREAPKTQLLNFLRNKELLLVLDNFEQLLSLPTAGESEPQRDLVIGLLAELMQATSGVKLLVTSRERLNLRAEWLFAVTGLPVPTIDDSGPDEDYAAVQLFVHSARRVLTGFTPSPGQITQIVRICHLVEGLPLAIELAASWTPVLTCAEMVSELELSLEILASPLHDTLAQQRSIRAVLDHAWQMVSIHPFGNLTGTFRGAVHLQTISESSKYNKCRSSLMQPE
jgi:DNA-binding SARP family transcriptional activator